MAGRGVLVCVALAGCGRIAFDEHSDAGADGASVFQPISLGPGGEATSIVASPTQANVFYAAVGARTFRSSDRAASWQPCDPAPLASVVIASPTVAQQIYVGAEDGLYRSDDDCATFRRVWQGGEVDTGIAWWQGELVFSAAGLFRYSPTTDQTMAMPSALDGEESGYIAVAGSVILATSPSAGAWRSTDGVTFTDVTNGVAEKQGVTFQPGAPAEAVLAGGDGAWASGDGGQSWTLAGSATDVRFALTFDPADPSFLVAIEWNGLARSLDGGASYESTQFRSGALGASNPYALAFDPGQPGRVLVSTARGIFASPDHSLTWAPTHAGIEAWVVLDITSVPGSSYVYAATPAGLAVSSDDGATWSLSDTGMSSLASYVTRVHVPDATVPDQVLTGGAPWLWETLDGAQTFNHLDTLFIGVTDGWEIRGIATSGTRGWVSTGSRTFLTTDGGQTWAPRTIAGLDRYTNDLLVTGTGASERIWVATEAGIFVSSDGGQSYSSAYVPALKEEVFSLTSSTSGKLYATGFAGVYARDNSPNASWRQCAAFDQGDGVWDVTTSGARLIVASSHGVFYSDDDCATWIELPGLRAQRPVALTVNQRGELLVGTVGFGLQRAKLP